MNKFAIVLMIGVILFFGFILIAYAFDPTFLGENTIWNKVFDSTANTIRIIGQ